MINISPLRFALSLFAAIITPFSRFAINAAALMLFFCDAAASAMPLRHYCHYAIAD
jgi:hypothetical protein